MSAITEIVSFARKLTNGRYVAAGNQVQLADDAGDPVGTVANPLVTTGGGAGGESQVQIVNGSGDPLGSEAFPFVVSQFVLAGSFTPTISASPDYAAGDLIGTVGTIAGGGAAGNRLVLDSVTIRDKAGQAPALVLFLCAQTLNGAGGTYTDNAPVVWGTGDKDKVMDVIAVAAANYKTVAGLSVQTLSNLGMVVHPNATDFFVAIVADGAYNAALTNDLTIHFFWRIASA